MFAGRRPPRRGSSTDVHQAEAQRHAVSPVRAVQARRPARPQLAGPQLALGANSPFLFGYAKPVPVNFKNLHNPRLDMVWVALAGPATNIILALMAALAFHALPLAPADWAP